MMIQQSVSAERAAAMFREKLCSRCANEHRLFCTLEDHELGKSVMDCPHAARTLADACEALHALRDIPVRGRP